VKNNRRFSRKLSRTVALGGRLAFGQVALGGKRPGTFAGFAAGAMPLAVGAWAVVVGEGCDAPAPAVLAASGSAPLVAVAKVDRSLRPLETEVVGTVRAVREASIAPLLGGTVTEVRVGIGSIVREGEILVRLSAHDVEARFAQAAAVAAQASRERDRATALKERGALPLAQYEAALSQWDVARARQEEAATVAEWRVLRAPFSGVVTGKRVNVGDTALPGQRLLDLEGRGAFRFEARVAESRGRDLSVGDRLPVRLDEIAHELAGTVAEIQPAADDATRTRLVKLALPKPSPAARETLRSGQFGRALLTTGSTFSVTVPAAAVERQGQVETVFVVEPPGVARLRLVRTGRERDGRVEIAGGLSGGEQVVLTSAGALVDGQQVRVQGEGVQ